jgi:hypothetical protein
LARRVHRTEMMFELVNVESLAAVLGGNGTARPMGGKEWDDVWKGVGETLDRMIAARPFAKICEESGNCYREPESGL